MKYLRQVFYEMTHQRMMTWVSISGTALAIFLVMIFFMSDQLATVEVAPETHRSRMMYGGGIDYKSPNMWASGSMAYPLLQRIYGSLSGIEKTGISSSWAGTDNASVKGKLAKSVQSMKTDADFWKLYDFNFISGKPFDESQIGGDEKRVIITRSVARDFFSKDDAEGEILYLNTVPYIVNGVVEDVNPTLSATFSNIYKPFTQSDIYPRDDKMGGMMIHLLLEPGVSEQSIKDQVRQRYDRLNQEWAKDSIEAIYHEAPHNAEYFATGEIFSNITPDISDQKTSRYAIYFVLMLIPAINLSAMMRGRLRHRISEIGVRRAFGAKRRNIVAQLLGENLIVTFIGGLIGLVLSILFMLFLSASFMEFGDDVQANALKFASYTPTISMLFTWKSFAVALGVCFILNLLSAFVPSWKASMVQPAEAISKSRA
ncbi:MAG: FtsX-like permease family protein [Clostridium sp.]|nr:FtsX-like permease family protein [Clostridium sp.]